MSHPRPKPIHMTRYLPFLLILLLLQCAGPRRAGFESSYQKALNAYYASLDDRDFNKALQKIDQVLQANPGDLESRILRAQVYLSQYRFQQNANSRDRLLRDLQSLERGLRPGDATSDWVAPRLYTTTGDWLLLEGNYQLIRLDTAQVQLSAPRRSANVTGVYALYRAAHHYYAYADSLAHLEREEAPSPGLLKERQHARDGLIHAHQGMLETLYRVDPNRRAPQTQARRQRLMDQFGRLLYGQSIQGPRMPSAALTFDPSVHRAAAIYYDSRNLQVAETLEERCAADAAPAVLDSLWHRRIRMAEEAAFHHLMEELLRPGGQVKQGEDDRFIQNLNFELTSTKACE